MLKTPFLFLQLEIIANMKEPSFHISTKIRTSPSETMKRLNNRPRKCLGFKDPIRYFSKSNQLLHLLLESRSCWRSASRLLPGAVSSLRIHSICWIPWWLICVCRFFPGQRLGKGRVLSNFITLIIIVDPCRLLWLWLTEKPMAYEWQKTARSLILPSYRRIVNDRNTND